MVVVSLVADHFYSRVKNDGFWWGEKAHKCRNVLLVVIRDFSPGVRPRGSVWHIAPIVDMEAYGCIFLWQPWGAIRFFLTLTREF